MSREEFQDQLDAIQGKTLDMADLVVERLDEAVAALRDGDAERARRVVEGDDVVNRRYLEIEDDCVDLLALQQPVASDLRFVVATFKIITDLERIADLAVNVAETADAAAAAPTLGESALPEAGEALTGVGDEARELVADAVAAYMSRDVEACHSVAAREEALDAAIEERTRGIVTELVAACDADGRTGQVVEEVSRLLLVLRDLERVGDHAVNIAARTLYMVEQDDALLY